MSSCLQCDSEQATKRCASCKVVGYCSRECQIAHWSIHKTFCSSLLAPMRDVNWRFVDRHEHPSLELFETCDTLLQDTLFEKYELDNLYPCQKKGYQFTGNTENLINMLESQNEIRTDCSFFVFMVAAVNFRIDTSVPFQFTYGSPNQPAWNFLDCQPFFLAPVPDLYSHVAGTSASAGQWLLPDRKGKYLGMSFDGPLVMTPIQWQKRLVDGLKKQMPYHDFSAFTPENYRLWPRAYVGIPDGTLEIV